MIEVTDPATALLSLSAVVIDTETTSLDVSRARIVQIGALKLSEGRIDENQTFDELIDPGEPVPASSKAIHGITDAKLRGKPQFAEVASRYAAFAGRQPVLGYSLGFDLAVLAREYARAGLVFAAPRSLDVRSLVDLVAPNLPDTALETVAAWLNFSSEGRHTALGDARITARVFLEIVPQLRRREIRTLAEAEASCRQHSDRNIAATQPVGGVDARSVTALARVDTWPYRHRVRDVMRTPPLIVPAAAALHEVLAQLLARRASSAFVDLGSARYGIITERDVLRALHSFGRDAPASPASAAASAPLEFVAADAFVYKAIGRMRRREFRHLGVLDAAGKLVGSLSQRDLLKLRADDAVALTDGIDEAAGVAALLTVWRNLTGAVRSLITEEADAHDAAAIISAEVCALTRRAAEMAARELPFVAPPQFCLMVLGSAGRGESLLAMDQDNAIVFEESSGGAGSDRWLESLAGHVNAILDEVGVPLCKGGVMARNPLWRKSTAGWRRHIAAVAVALKPRGYSNADIFFDAVPVYGEAGAGRGTAARCDNRRRFVPGLPETHVQQCCPGRFAIRLVRPLAPRRGSA